MGTGPFRHLLLFWFLLTPTLHFAFADQLELLSNPILAGKRRLDFIKNAKNEIILSSYILSDDTAGNMALAYLLDACNRGVKVILTIDGSGNQISKEKLSLLADAGADIQIYNPFHWSNAKKYLERMHDKLLIIDSEHLFVGDRNLGNEYFGLTSNPFVSKDLYLRGDESKKAREYVLSLIESKEVEKFVPATLSGEKKQSLLAFFQKQLKRTPTRILNSQNPSLVFDVAASKVKFVFDTPSDTLPKLTTQSEIFEVLNSAKRSIVLENPYIILTPELKELLQRKAKEGVKITVYTNSYRSQHNVFLWFPWPEDRRFFASLGATIWEHPGVKQKTLLGLRKLANPTKSLASLHSKTFIVDNETTIVSSYNLDPRSQNINSEVGLIVKDIPLAMHTNQTILEEAKTLKYKKVVDSGKIAPKVESCPWIFEKLISVVKSQM